MARIFLSYARADGSEIAKEMVNRLRALEHQVFFDTQSIRAGKHWKIELKNHIKWADAIVVLVTPESNDSDYVFEEISAATDHGKMIIPIRVQDTPLPVHLRGTWHAVTFENNNYDTILLEIERTLKSKSSSKAILLTAALFIAVAITIGGVLFLVLQNNPDPIQPTNEASDLGNGATSILDTQVTIATNIPTDEDSKTSTSTQTETRTLTSTVTSPIVPTDTPTIRVTPSITPTRTPRPTNTPTFTPTPIPEDLILYQADFEDGRLSGDWHFGGEYFSSVIEEDSGNHVWLFSNGGADLTSSYEWTDYALYLRYYIVERGTEGLAFDVRKRNNFQCRSYSFAFSVTWLAILKPNSSSNVCPDLTLPEYYLAGRTIGNTARTWHTLYIEVDGENIRWQYDNETLYEAFDQTHSMGGIGFSTDATIWLDDIMVWSLED